MARLYQAYSKYKETDSEWMDRVPIDWDVMPLKFVTSSKVKDGPHETPKFINEGIPFFSVDGIQEHQLIFEGCRFISRDDHERFSLKCRPKKGDVLLGKAASVGKVAYVDTDNEFNVWSPLAVITPKCQETGRFIFYSLQSASLQAQCDVFSNSNTQKNLSMQTIDNLAFAFPEASVANQIANFLDHETAKIDTLIEKQQQLIKLLKEKRQAVISHAVTKGLNPKAPMRDSGVEWLGEVPEHWDVVPIKRICEVKDGTHDTPQYVDKTNESYPLITSKDFNGNSISFDTAKYISIEDHTEIIKRSNTEVGDVLMSMIGGNIGKALVVIETADFSIKNVALFKTVKSEELAKYILFYLQSGLLDVQISLLSRGGAQGFLSLGDLRNLVFFKLPHNELEDIVEYLSKRVIKLDNLIEKAESAIVLMQERRTALISAAVTGKIDVRNWQPQNSSSKNNNKEVAA